MDKLRIFVNIQERLMDACYRSMPKFIGAFFDTLYQHPTILFISMAGVMALAGSWWYKANKKTE
ncbi:hypothetical protein [Methylomarinum vadi]|uniref:hypothetical protein n=1 Tax=Methylomarinum vadi TaxID=438855 RepID=UPI0004DF1097|nr:hypothetical protein [Methylomarinum vadi]